MLLKENQQAHFTDSLWEVMEKEIKTWKLMW